MSLLTLLLQISVILVVARAFGWLFRKVNQPQVIGEMVAGILLGPSLLGWLSPDVSAWLFPPDSLDALHALSQVGLLLFMFLVGLEFDHKLLRGLGRTAVVTSNASILVPFLLGIGLSVYLYPLLSEGQVSWLHFALFMGAAMSVTAFPVLARILTERNLLRSRLGALIVACAAAADVTAWCILAGLIALVRASTAHTPLVVTLLGTGVYVALMLLVLRPVLHRIEAYYHTRGRMTQDILAMILLLLLASAWATEWLGVHALFGAFILGAVLPKEPGFVHDLNEKLEDVTVVLLLPLFFAYTGLRTQIGLLDTPALWLDGALVVLVAVVGKFGGAALAGRWMGLRWREAGALGAMMNTRGLMELVILTIGLDLGIISPTLFVMMVIMALVTTFMTTPLLEWIYPSRLIQQERIGRDEKDEGFSVLIPVSFPSSGPELLRVATALAPPRSARIYALHLMRPDEEAGLTGSEVRPADQEALQPLLQAAHQREVPVRPLAFVSRNLGADITGVAHAKAVNLVLMGWHKPVLSQSILSGAVYEVMQHTKTDVAVYLARTFNPWKRVLVPFSGGRHDHAALRLAQRLAQHLSAEITILHVVKPERAADDPRLGLSETGESLGPENVRLKVVEHADPQQAAVEEARQGYDLVIIGASEAWGLEPTLFSTRHEQLAYACPASMLIVRQGGEAPLPVGARPAHTHAPQPA
jgi:Kef-type K+ transport system membrane component KefB/nucleotide-binding universal stress UspA family protein